MKIKLQDFARECGVTDRAIQKHIQKHEEALRGHFERRGPNGTWLDEYAQDYIRSLMVQPSTPVVADAMLVRENRELVEANKILEARDQVHQETIAGLMAKVAELSETVGQLKAADGAQKLLTDSLRSDLDLARQEGKDAREARQKAEERAKDLEVSLAKQQAREAALMNRSLLQRIRNTEIPEV